MFRNCLPIPQKIYRITKKRLRTPQEIEQYFPCFLSFIDCTEQQIPRPKNKKRKKEYYSGKKQRHTVKTQFVVNNRGFIIHKTAKKKGRHRHDYNIYRENHPLIPKQVVNVVDLGYIGIEKDFPQQLSSTTNRKKRNLQLSRDQKEYNQSHSKKRIIMSTLYAD